MYFSTALPLAALLSLTRAHGVILNAQGEAGSPPSIGFQVNEAIARNCTTISPCQLDATIIRDAEVAANIVNKCGRTQLAGNIDIGENTENALAANTVTSVKAGSQLIVTIHQVNADGAGPYVCDLDETSNSGLISQNLTVTNNVPGVNGLSQAKAQDFNITVTMPDKFSCTGASTGNICTVRCRNNAVAGPFGGCFAVQQVDTTPKVNTPSNIATADPIDGVLNQIERNKADLTKAVKANQIAGGEQAQQNAAAVTAILGLTVTTKASPTSTPDVVIGGGGAAAAAPAVDTTTTAAGVKATTTAAAAATTTKARKGNKGNTNNQNTNQNNNQSNNQRRWWA